MDAKHSFCSNLLVWSKSFFENWGAKQDFVCEARLVLLFKHFWCKASLRLLFKYFGWKFKARLLFKHVGCEWRLLFKFLDAKEDFCSKVLGEKQDFCSTILIGCEGRLLIKCLWCKSLAFWVQSKTLVETFWMQSMNVALGFNCVVKLPHSSQCKTFDIC